MCHVRRCTRSVSSHLPKRCRVASLSLPRNDFHYSLSIATTSLQGRENHRKSRKRGMGGGGGGGQVMKRIPRIKFPERQPNPKPSNSGPNPFIFIKVLLLHIFLTWYYYYI